MLLRISFIHGFSLPNGHNIGVKGKAARITKIYMLLTIEI